MDAPIRACVVIPTYNERETIPVLLKGLEDLGLPGLQVLVVDDSSPDGTAGAVRAVSVTKPWVRLVSRERKKGIGSAYQDGFRTAIRDTDSNVLVEMDADLQHPPSSLPLLLGAIQEGADVAVGSRYMPGGGTPGWSSVRRSVSRGANAYSRLMLGLKVKDATSGFRAYTREAAVRVASAALPAKGFEFQVASLYLLKGTSKIVEVPFVFAARAAGESKLRLRDMARFFLSVAKISLTRKRGSRRESKTEIRGTAADF